MNRDLVESRHLVISVEDDEQHHGVRTGVEVRSRGRSSMRSWGGLPPQLEEVTHDPIGGSRCPNGVGAHGGPGARRPDPLSRWEHGRVRPVLSGLESVGTTASTTATATGAAWRVRDTSRHPSGRRRRQSLGRPAAVRSLGVFSSRASPVSHSDAGNSAGQHVVHGRKLQRGRGGLCACGLRDSGDQPTWRSTRSSISSNTCSMVAYVTDTPYQPVIGTDQRLLPGRRGRLGCRSVGA